MADMEEKFQEILGNEQAMSQIMSIAQSLGGGSNEVLPAPTGGEDSGMNFGQMMGGIDPKYLAMGMRLMSAYQSQHRSMEFVRAVQPFLKTQREEMVDRLSKATRWARVATSILEIVTEWRQERMKVESSSAIVISQEGGEEDV